MQASAIGRTSDPPDLSIEIEHRPRLRAHLDIRIVDESRDPGKVEHQYLDILAGLRSLRRWSPGPDYATV